MTTSEDKEIEFTCPRCGRILNYGEGETLSSLLPCPDCGWDIKKGLEDEVPDEFKIPIT